MRGPEGAPKLDPDAMLEGLKPILEDPKVAEGQPEHQVRPARPAGRRVSSWPASPATRWSPTTCLHAGERSHSLDDWPAGISATRTSRSPT